MDPPNDDMGSVGPRSQPVTYLADHEASKYLHSRVNKGSVRITVPHIPRKLKFQKKGGVKKIRVKGQGEGISLSQGRHENPPVGWQTKKKKLGQRKRKRGEWVGKSTLTNITMYFGCAHKNWGGRNSCGDKGRSAIKGPPGGSPPQKGASDELLGLQIPRRWGKKVRD